MNQINKQQKEFKTIDEQEIIINCFGGRQGRKLVLRIIDLLRPEFKTDTNNLTSKEVAQKLVSGSDDSFVSKADKIISEIFEKVYIKVGDGFIPVDDNTFDLHFSCRYAAMLEILVEVMEFNGFFELIVLLKRMKHLLPTV